MEFASLLRSGNRILSDSDYRFLFLASKGFYNSMSDSDFLRKKFAACTGYKLNLENPKTFNEKLQWLKINDHRAEYTIMVDKLLVRDYIANTIGKDYLIPLLGVWDDPNEINFDNLPEQFVLKCNHNSGLGMCICKDKSILNIKKTKRELSKGLAQDYYLSTREWPYKNVPHRIIAEAYMEDRDTPDALNDYKILCFNGEPKLIEVHKGRFTNHYTQNFYTIDWSATDISQPGDPMSCEPVQKPMNFNEMMEFSRRLAKGIPHVRVDWYEVNGALYFGELTFYDGSGFLPFNNPEYDILLGSWIELPKK